MDIGNWASNQADITAWDGRWCTDWSGLATPVTNAFGANTTYWDGHVDWMWVQINTCSGSYAVNASYKPTRAVACQELGHATTAELHAGPGCMGFGYFNFNAEDAAQRSPSAHDVEGANFLWGGTH
jgi:prepilin-type processing-associated H-X9-DG protein